jgi:hypothetical protein
MSSEMYQDTSDTPLFVPVDLSGNAFLMGDIFIFGKKNLDDARKLHVAVYTGEVNEEGEPMILHATKPINKDDSGIYVWSFPTFFGAGRYEELYGVRRLSEELHGKYVRPVINSHANNSDDYHKTS